MKKVFTVLILMYFTLVGCSGKQEKTEGYILEVEEHRILLAENISAEEYQTIKNKSISELAEEEIPLIYFSYDEIVDLQEGNKVEIWFNGNIATSYPAQAGAIKIEVKE